VETYSPNTTGSWAFLVDLQLFEYHALDTSDSEAYREIAIMELLQDGDSDQDASQAEREHVP
jgi:hypothetical protein